MRKHFHLIGIGGIGMGTLASLLLAQGHKVTGSDIKDNQMTMRLRGEGARIFIGHQSYQVEGADCVIYSSAVGADNPEILGAIVRQIPILKRAEMLARLMNVQIAITVAGAHGKTTTTSMVSKLLMNAGYEPTTAVGGVINGGNYNANLGEGKYFVAEVDESDGSFLYFEPQYSIITNIDFEHVDYYEEWKNILKAYRQFILQTKKEGFVIAYGEDDRLRSLLKEARVKTRTYGLSNDLDFYADNIVLDGYFSNFDCYQKEKWLGQIILQVPGKHNILNALACIALGRILGIDFDIIALSLKDFTGVKRRFQLKKDIHHVMIVDDYGHHPTEIRATLETARSFKRDRIITVFQPHRYTRTKYLMDEFVESLIKSDYLILTDIYAAGEEPLEGVSTQELYEKVKKSSTIPVVYLKKEEIIGHLLNIIRQGDMVITLGAGDITAISDELARLLTPVFKKSDVKSQ